MPSLKSKPELATAAKDLAASFALVQRGAQTYIPVHWLTFEADPPPAPEERIWLPFSREEKMRLANSKSNILFANDGELRNFDFMMRQIAKQNTEKVGVILVKTEDGMQALNEQGELVDHDGTFTPNYIRPMLNTNSNDKKEVFDVLVEWLGSEEDAKSLLHHLATCLAPGWSAVKYILLIGEGRNGKSVLLTMLAELFGEENVSHVSRQMMAEHSPTCVELNDKLLNVIFDGEMSYIKDSSMEKTLIAGERGVVRMLYESGTTNVQTNALFIEALQVEPKTRDKSSALQKRLVRFNFPNVYKIDKEFSKRMTSDRMLGALLSLLIDNYVKEDELAEKLTLTKGSMELQMEQVWLGSPILQYLEFLTSSGKLNKLVGMQVDTFMTSFKPWAEAQGMHDRSDGDVLTMMKTSFELGWKSERANGKVTNARIIKGLRPETVMALENMKGDLDGAQDPGEELVGDAEL